jgi:hypothetical protein
VGQKLVGIEVLLVVLLLELVLLVEQIVESDYLFALLVVDY